MHDRLQALIDAAFFSVFSDVPEEPLFEQLPLDTTHQDYFSIPCTVF